MHRKLGRFGGDEFQRLVNGHGLRAGDHTFDSSKVGVLPGNRHLAGQLLRRQCLNGTTRRGVVGGNDAVDFVVVAGQGVFNNAQRFGRVPFLHPLLPDDLDITLVDGRLQHFHLAFAQHLGVVVGGRTTEQKVVALGCGIQHAAGLHLADLFVIEGNVGVDISVENEPIIGHNFDPGFLRFGHRVGQHRGVERHDDDDIDAPGNKVFDLGNLLLLVGIGRLHEDLGVHFFCRRDEVITVTRPAFQAQVINGETDFRVGSVSHHRQ
ncbi:hypothetical protein D3C81_1207580 [compost metagenome]